MNGNRCRRGPESGSGELVGQRPGVAGQVGGVGVEFVQELGQGPVDPGGVVAVQGDGDRLGGVGDDPGLVHQGAGDRPVFVGVAQVDVEVVGQPGVGVVGQQPQGHDQAAAVGSLQGAGGVGVDEVGGQLDRDGVAGGGRVADPGCG